MTPDLIAVRGDERAYAKRGFDPTKDMVLYVAPNRKPRLVNWQSLLSRGYWQPPPAVSKARDGDGDGFVYDGTPRMRPARPDEMKGAKLKRLLGKRRGERGAAKLTTKKPSKKGRSGPFRNLSYTPGKPDKYHAKNRSNTAKYNRERIGDSYDRIVEMHPELAERVSKKEHEQQTIDRLTEILKEGDLVIRAPTSAVPKIVKDGRFRTQHDTGTSGGLMASDYRDQVEQRHHGLSIIAEPDKRPIYGAFEDRETKGESFADQYGHIGFVMKPSVANRTTLTFGDSLDNEDELYPIQRRTLFNGSATQNEILTSINPEYLEQLAEELAWASTDSPLDPDDMMKGDGVVEAQIHGPVRTSQVAEVISTDGRADKAAQRAADALGVPFRKAH